MAIRIDLTKCNGCGKAVETRCERICPGNLLYRGEGHQACIRDVRDCWDCAACVKECPRQAIEMFLPAQVGGRGAGLKAKKEANKIIWTLRKPNGDTESIEVLNETVL